MKNKILYGFKRDIKNFKIGDNTFWGIIIGFTYKEYVAYAVISANNAIQGFNYSPYDPILDENYNILYNKIVFNNIIEIRIDLL